MVKQIKFLKVEKEADDSGQVFLCMGKRNCLQHRVLETALLVLGFYLHFGTDTATPVA